MRSGLCECGCGQSTKLARYTRADRGDIAGEPVRFVLGHANRVNERYVVTPGPLATPCHIATVGVGDQGYAHWRNDDGCEVPAHRLVWEAANGPVPDGLILDHLCRIRACVNSDHMEPVTFRENVLRGEGPTAINARKTHCPRGHPLEGDNLYSHADGRRECWTCRRAAGAAYMRRKRAAA